MSRWARRKGIDTFEREWSDDPSYIRDMIDASPRGAWLVSRVTHLLAAALVGRWPCRTAGRTRLGPAGRRHCLRHDAGSVFVASMAAW